MVELSENIKIIMNIIGLFGAAIMAAMIVMIFLWWRIKKKIRILQKNENNDSKQQGNLTHLNRKRKKYRITIIVLSILFSTLIFACTGISYA